MVIIRPVEQSPPPRHVTMATDASISSRPRNGKYNGFSDVFYTNEYEEDNNDHLSYIDCRLLVPSSVFAAISLMAIFIGLSLGYFYNLQSKQNENVPAWLYASGWYTLHCNDSKSSSVPDWYLPSVLRLLELTVQANIFFRIATCIPNALRLFQSYLHSAANAYFCSDVEDWLWYRWCNCAAPALLLIELSSCTIFSINTIRQDYQIVYRISFILFVISALLHMMACTATTIYRTKRNLQTIDHISVVIKLISMIGFGITAPQVTIFHGIFINNPACHCYVPPYQALCEYILIICNAAFHLTSIIDTRNLRFLMYPRTCSGECESLSPENFQKGGKFEYCRSQYYLDRKHLGYGEVMQQTAF